MLNVVIIDQIIWLAAFQTKRKKSQNSNDKANGYILLICTLTEINKLNKQLRETALH